MADTPKGQHFGRKAGTPNKATAERRLAFEQALKVCPSLSPEAASMTPLAVLLTAMRWAWDRGQIDAAVKIACLAAPYSHPRLTSADVNVTHSDAEKSDDMLLAELVELRRKQAAARPH